MDKKPNHFDFLNSILYNKEDLLADGDPAMEKAYPAFMVNRGLSLHYDCVGYANWMNAINTVDRKMQYDALMVLVSKRKMTKYSMRKWPKRIKDNQLDAVMTHYGYNYVRAHEALKVLTEEQIDEIVKYEELKESFRETGRPPNNDKQK